MKETKRASLTHEEIVLMQDAMKRLIRPDLPAEINDLVKQMIKCCNLTQKPSQSPHGSISATI